MSRPPRSATYAFSALLAAVLVVLSLAGCAQEAPNDSPNSASPAPTPRAGGSLTVAYLTAPATFDPVRADNRTERAVARAVHEGLLRYASKPGADGTQLQVCLATAVPTLENGGLSGDGLVYTFTLRDGLRFQPPLHRELEAADVKYSLERMLRLATAETRSLWTNVTGVSSLLSGRADHATGITIVDRHTIAFRLIRRDPLLLHALAQVDASVVAREWIDKWRGEYGLHPLGTGPFIFLKRTSKDEIKLAKNPEYWERGLPYVDAVELRPRIRRGRWRQPAVGWRRGYPRLPTQRRWFPDRAARSPGVGGDEGVAVPALRNLPLRQHQDAAVQGRARAPRCRDGHRQRPSRGAPARGGPPLCSSTTRPISPGTSRAARSSAATERRHGCCCARRGTARGSQSSSRSSRACTTTPSSSRFAPISPPSVSPRSSLQ